jgi:hypothetical protein
MMNNLRRSLSYSSNHKTSSDSINCDCKHDKCEFRFRFVAFQEEALRSGRAERNHQHHQPRNIFNYHNNHHHNRHHKSLMLTIGLKDLNDNLPLFKKNFYYLNISEQIGSSKNQQDTKEMWLNTMNCAKSSQTHSIIQQSMESTLIPLETAFDYDVSQNAVITYTLVLFKNTSNQFLPTIEAETNKILREAMIREALEMRVRNCSHLFELIETDVGRDSDFEHSIQSQLFLKVNTHLDREEQDVFNFILIATDLNSNISQAMHSKFSKDLQYFIHENNYMLIQISITDLNDNSPVFDQLKYTFKMNEITEFKNYYTENNLEEYDSYFFILNKTCLSMREIIKVKAIDNDMDLNGQIKYKIIQQVFVSKFFYFAYILRFNTS